MLATVDHRTRPRKRWIALGGFVGVLVLGGLGIQSKARAVAEEEAAEYVTSFSALRDPESFAEQLMVVLPRPVVPMNRRDAVARELLVRSKTMSKPMVLHVADALVEEAQSLGYDPLLLLAVIRIESNYNHLAISPVGAEGLMQLMPPTAVWMAERAGVEWPDGHSFDPVINVRLGSRYLAYLDQEFKGRMDLALTAYNRGPYATRAIVRRHGGLPRDILDFYATKVLDRYHLLLTEYGHLPSS